VVIKANAFILGADLIVLLIVVSALAAVPQTNPNDDPEVHPQVTKTDLKIVHRARQILDDPAK
jgi:hypothetical protein